MHLWPHVKAAHWSLRSLVRLLSHSGKHPYEGKPSSPSRWKARWTETISKYPGRSDIVEKHLIVQCSIRADHKWSSQHALAGNVSTFDIEDLISVVLEDIQLTWKVGSDGLDPTKLLGSTAAMCLPSGIVFWRTGQCTYTTLEILPWRFVKRINWHVPNHQIRKPHDSRFS